MSKVKNPPKTSKELTVSNNGLSSELISFKAQIDAQGQRRAMLEEFIKKSLIEGTDYGSIHIAKDCPNKYDCKNKGHYSKPVLFKPGSEKLCQLSQLKPIFKLDKDTMTALNTQDTAIFICELVNNNGQILSEGRGACSLSEKRNWNEALKIGEKRSQVDATLRLFALSDVFTQDLEDIPEEEKEFNPETAVCNFKKHKGKLWKDLPTDYLRWIHENTEYKKEVEKTFEYLNTTKGQVEEIKQETGMDLETEVEPQNDNYKNHITAFDQCKTKSVAKVRLKEIKKDEKLTLDEKKNLIALYETSFPEAVKELAAEKEKKNEPA